MLSSNVLLIVFGLPSMHVNFNQTEDPWLAPDKAQHFAFCFACTSAAYLFARRFSLLRPHRLLIGAAAGIGEITVRRAAAGELPQRSTAARPCCPPLCSLQINWEITTFTFCSGRSDQRGWRRAAGECW